MDKLITHRQINMNETKYELMELNNFLFFIFNKLTLLKWNLGLKKIFLTLIKASLKLNI